MRTGMIYWPKSSPIVVQYNSQEWQTNQFGPRLFGFYIQKQKVENWKIWTVCLESPRKETQLSL